MGQENLCFSLSSFERSEERERESFHFVPLRNEQIVFFLLSFVLSTYLHSISLRFFFESFFLTSIWSFNYSFKGFHNEFLLETKFFVSFITWVSFGSFSSFFLLFFFSSFSPFSFLLKRIISSKLSTLYTLKPKKNRLSFWLEVLLFFCFLFKKAHFFFRIPKKRWHNKGKKFFFSSYWNTVITRNRELEVLKKNGTKAKTKVF